MPIIWRRRQAPTVLRFFKIDSAVSRLVWLDIHDVGYCPFACENDMNPDFHAYAQCDGCQDQGAVKVDDERFAFAVKGSLIPSASIRTLRRTRVLLRDKD
jgi:hypothetical protein